MKFAYDIIKKPVITERSMMGAQDNKYTFEVAKEANKVEIKKAVEDAKKNIFTVPVIGTTIPHEITGRYGAGSVYMRPAIEGTGVIAGGATRAILELAGISDILTKCLGSRTKINVVRATVDALQNLRTVESVAALRGKKPEEIRG